MPYQAEESLRPGLKGIDTPDERERGDDGRRRGAKREREGKRRGGKLVPPPVV